MPYAPPKVCARPGCGRTTHGRFCAEHAKARQEERAKYDQRRGSSMARGYGARWQKAREGFLRKHPLCVECSKRDEVTPATVVDHIIPHRGDQKLFWDKKNWQPLCKRCHDSWKQSVEKSGQASCGCDVFGYPVQSEG